MALTSSELSFKSGTISLIRFLLFEFPTAISTFLINLSLPTRLMLEPENFSLKSHSFHVKKDLIVGSISSSRGAKSISLVFFAYLFHGQIAKQSSHP